MHGSMSFRFMIILYKIISDKISTACREELIVKGKSIPSFIASSLSFKGTAVDALSQRY